MVHFEQTTAKSWTTEKRGQTIGTITELAHGYEVKHADGYEWVYDTLDAAQDSFLDPDE